MFALLIANVAYAVIFRRWIFASFSTFLILNLLNWMAVDGLLGALLFPYCPSLWTQRGYQVCWYLAQTGRSSASFLRHHAVVPGSIIWR